jgi:hypothetical protein
MSRESQYWLICRLADISQYGTEGMPEFTLSGFAEAGLPQAEMVTGLMDRFHDFFLTLEYEPIEALPRGSGDIVVIVDKVNRRSKLEQLARYEGRVVMVAAPTDAPFWSCYLPGHDVPANFLAAFVANNDLDDRRVVNVPVGVRREKAERCRSAADEQTGPRDGLLYGNFNVKPAIYRPDASGAPHIRHRLAERFAGERWATIDVSDGVRRGDAPLSAYYAEVARHRFVLSPEGLAVDCYRHWECLYLGAIPIVRRSVAMESFSDLPILFTDDYSEIDEDYLGEQWELLGERRFEFERLMKSFYRERFLKSVAQLTSPRLLCWTLDGGRP